MIYARTLIIKCQLTWLMEKKVMLKDANKTACQEIVIVALINFYSAFVIVESCRFSRTPLVVTVTTRKFNPRLV